MTASRLTGDRLPATPRRRLPGDPLPVLRLARLAVDQRVKGLVVDEAQPMLLPIAEVAR